MEVIGYVSTELSTELISVLAEKMDHNIISVKLTNKEQKLSGIAHWTEETWLDQPTVPKVSSAYMDAWEQALPLIKEFIRNGG